MVEQMPQFPGGPAELLKYIAKNLKYPVIAQENGIQGKVILRFVVNAQGHVENVKVLRSLDPYCDKEAIRVVKSLPQWIPGNRTGVTYRFIIPALLFLNYSNHQVYEKKLMLYLLCMLTFSACNSSGKTVRGNLVFGRNPHCRRRIVQAYHGRRAASISGTDSRGFNHPGLLQ